MGLNVLDSGFTAGDLDIKGYFGAIAAYQTVYIADGRPRYDTSGELLDIHDSGYHKIDMTSTMIIGDLTGTLVAGNSLLQEGTDAAGIFVESIDATTHLIYRTTTTEFNSTDIINKEAEVTYITPSIIPPATTAVFSPPHWLNWTLAANEFSGTGGTFPDGGSNDLELFEGRIWMNSMFNPNQFFATRQGFPLDLDTSLDDVGAAISSQTSEAGLVADALIKFIRYKDNYLLFGCANSFWILRGGSTGAGSISNLTYETGLFSPDSYCWDNNGNLYIVGLTGFFKFPNNMAVSGVAIDNILLRKLPNLFRVLQLNRKTDRVVMGFDKDTNRISVSISTQDGSWSVCFCYDISSDSIIPDTFSGGNVPSCFLYMNSYQDEISGLLIGCYNGYIKKFDSDVKTDDGEIIESYTLFGPITINTLLRANVKIKEVLIILSEAADGVKWELYQAKSNELIVKGIKEGTLSPTHSGTFTNGGREATIYEKIAGESLAIVLRNNTLNNSWGLENIKIRYSIAGRIKD